MVSAKRRKTDYCNYISFYTILGKFKNGNLYDFIVKGGLFLKDTI